jgi:hypothetical protein
LPKSLHVLENLRHLLLLPLLHRKALGLHSLHPLAIGLPQGLQLLDLSLEHFTTMFKQ